MAASDISIIGGTPERFYSKTINPPKLNPSGKETQESLKRSFEKYLASDMPSPTGIFVPSKHLAYEEPKYIHTMEDIGYPSTKGVSPIAVSEPFRLFSEEAVDIMRSEVFDADARKRYTFTSDIACKQLRGYAPK